jgi:predicted nucleotidyltransferase
MGKHKSISVSDALFSGGQKRVLGLLFGQPDRAFYSNEIAKLVKSGRGALQRELERLLAAGLIKSKLMGRQKYFQANKESFLYSELRSIVMKTFGLGDVLRDALSVHADKIDYAFIYGSVAKGTDTAASDVDLMVIARGLRYSDLFEALATAENKLGRKVSPTIYSRPELAKKIAGDNHFVKNVLNQPKIVLLGSEDVVRPRKAA